MQEDHVESRPTIRETSQWTMERGCGYERCGGPPVDFLVGQDLRIRIETFSDDKQNRFAILLDLIPLGRIAASFNPASVIVELANKTQLRASGYRCSGRIWDAEYRKKVTPLQAPVLVPKSNCFALFFEAQPPRIDDEYKMRINGVVVEGHPVKIPEVTFRKTITRW